MTIPRFPDAFAAKPVDLGAPKRYFPVRNLNRVGSLVAFYIFSGGSVLVFLYGLYVTHAAYQKHGPALIDDLLTLPVIIAFVMLLLGLAAAGFTYVNWNKGVGIYDRGIAVRDRKGILAWRWEEIVSLTATVTRPYAIGIVTGTTHVYSLFNHLNRHLVITDVYVKVEELVKLIQDGIFPILYERAAQQYNAGQRLVFGPVAISRAGIELGKKTVPWTEVQQVSIQQGILKVSKKGGGWSSGASATVSVIPNLNVLLNLIDQVVGLKVG